MAELIVLVFWGFEVFGTQLLVVFLLGVAGGYFELLGEGGVHLGGGLGRGRSWVVGESGLD